MERGPVRGPLPGRPIPRHRSQGGSPQHRASKWRGGPSRLRVLGFAALVSCALTSCELLGPPPPAEAWHLTSTVPLDVEPGASITLDVTLDDPALATQDIAVWVDSPENRTVRLPLLVPDAQDGSAARQLRLPAPGIVPGTYALRVGDASGPKSNALDLRIRTATRKLPRDEAAALLADGLAAIATETWAVLNDASADAFRGQAYPDAFWQDAGALFQAVAGWGSAAAAEYLALPDDVELQLQAYLQNSGVLDVMRALVSPDPTSMPTAQVGDDRVSRHLWLLGLDIVTAYFHATQVSMDAATLVMLLGGVTVEAGVIPGLISASIRTLRFFIQTFVPTDLVSIAPHRYVAAYENHWIKALYWGRFRPQEKITAGVITWGVDTVFEAMKIAIAEMLPKPLKPVVKEALDFVLAKIGAHVLLAPAIPVVGQNPGDYYVEEQVALALWNYDVSLADLVGSAVPIGFWTPLVWAFVKAANWQAPQAAMTATWDPNSSIGQGTFWKDHQQDNFGFTNVPCSDGRKGIALHHIEVHGYRFDTRDAPVIGGTWYDVPWITYLAPSQHEVTVQCLDSSLPWLDATVPTRYFAPLYTRIQPTSTTEGSVVKGASDAERDRVIQVRVEDASICRDIGKYPTVRLETLAGTVVGPITLGAGSNSLETFLSLPAKAGDFPSGYSQVQVDVSTDCVWPGESLVRMRIFFLGAINGNVAGDQTVYFLEEAQPTVHEVIEVWVPPGFD